MKILITSARAPIALDMAHILKQKGHVVILTDCTTACLGAKSNVGLFFKTRAPAIDFEGFKTDILKLITDQSIDLIIPTSEEVFWLSMFKLEIENKNAEHSCKLFSMSIDSLDILHDKRSFMELWKAVGHCLKTKEITSDTNTYLLANQFGIFEKSAIIKKIHSRFGTSTIMEPTIADLETAKKDHAKGFSWIIQEKAIGEEICIYSIFRKGVLIGLYPYYPLFRTNASAKHSQGAGLYFKPVTDVKILQKISMLLTRFSTVLFETRGELAEGQMSFDAILQNGELYFLECNPRGTSGVHLAVQDEQYPSLLVGSTKPETDKDFDAVKYANLSKKIIPKKLALAIILTRPSLRLVFSKSYRTEFLKASDCLTGKISLIALMQVFLQTYTKSILKRKSILDVTTYDIEYRKL